MNKKKESFSKTINNTLININDYFDDGANTF